MTTTKQWQFPAWEDMVEIDINKPLVTRGGEVVTARARNSTPTQPILVYVYAYHNTDMDMEVTTTSYGREYAQKPPIEALGDIQNPPEWAYQQFGIEPPKDASIDITVSVALEKQMECVELVDQLATEPCPGTYTSMTGQRKTCGRCPTCRCRSLLGVTKIPATETVCETCGLQG